MGTGCDETMRAREIMEDGASGGASAGSTSSSSMAPVSMAMGMQTRSGGSMLSGKYITDSDPTPNTPKEYKRTQHARRQFKNSPSK
jgi:hypothetical protein